MPKRTSQAGMSQATKEAMGCFILHVFGTLTAIGVVLILSQVGMLRSRNSAGWWRLALVMVVGPAIVSALATWVLYGVKKNTRSKGQRRRDRASRWPRPPSLTRKRPPEPPVS
jgi:hypothetical protein